MRRYGSLVWYLFSCCTPGAVGPSKAGERKAGDPRKLGRVRARVTRSVDLPSFPLARELL